MRLPTFALMCFAALHLSCGGQPGSSSSSANSGPPSLTLQSTPVTVQPGQEDYLCWSFAVPAGAPLDVVSTLPQIPQGVHHYAIFTNTAAMPANPVAYDCHDMGITWGLVNAGGVGTPGMTFPKGTALELPAGMQVILQLHILNASTTALSLPAVNVKLEGSTDPNLEQVGLLLAGTLNIDIPANDANGTATGTCQPGTDMQNVFAVFPHMHTLGTHIKVGVTPAGGAAGGSSAPTSSVIYDAGWNFGAQGVYPVHTSIGAKDTITVDCNYDNTTDKEVKFGLSTTDEMCFGVLYYYPATKATTYCGLGAGNGP